MRSALTAALSGKGPPAKVAQKQQKADGNSFPCLADGQEASQLAAEQDDVVSEMEKFTLKGANLAGSAPTAVLLPNGAVAADYELNPYRRRGGEERVPSISTSVDDKLRWRSLGSASLQSNFMQDSIIGSLPNGLSVAERDKILQSTPLSPTLNLLSSLPSDRVSSRSLEGRRLRRHVLRGAVILFVTAGYSGKRFIFEKAKELGVRSVIIDGPDSWCSQLQTEGIIERFVPLDFSEGETVFERCLETCNKIRRDFGELDGVCTFCEMAVPLVARLAEALGLPGCTPASVDAARDKHATRTALAAAGLPSPRNLLIHDEADLAKAAELVGFPAVIKPIFGAASIGVVRVNNKDELDKAYKRVQREMSHAKIVAGALAQGSDDESDVQGNAATWIKTTLMMEEYLDGPEVDVDIIFSEGQAVYGAITDNWPTVEPYFNETGSNCPSILPSAQQRELLDLAVLSVKALGLKQGVFHVELKYTKRGARLIEVNCRMGGGPVRNTNLLVWGVDLVEEHLLTTAGIPSRPPVARKPLMNIAEYSINAAKTGRMVHTRFCDAWQSHPDVLYARPLVSAGQKVTSVQDGMPTWVCEIMVKKPTVQEAIDFVLEIERSLDIPIEEGK